VPSGSPDLLGNRHVPCAAFAFGAWGRSGCVSTKKKSPDISARALPILTPRAGEPRSALSGSHTHAASQCLQQIGRPRMPSKAADDRSVRGKGGVYAKRSLSP
jgi:hypothetical protein